jgi:phage FluMu protein gp41
MKRIVEAAGPFQTETLRGSQRDAYEKTLRALADVDALDDDEVVAEIVDWIVDRVEANQAFPGSRAIRRQAATVCRAQGYEISNNDWLGV